jgi:outer membrane murein-binding lipoprotein Lpp
MSTIEMAVEELNRLPGSKVEEVAALIHQLAQDVDEQKRQAFAASFASMSAEEANAFQRVIDEACERID